MNKKKISAIALLFAGMLHAQTEMTHKIVNSGFETGTASGWTWSGTSGYTWVGVNTDGDQTKTGSYIAGTWNAEIGDVELSQTITGLDNGMYIVTGDLMGSSNATTSRLTTQRIFANNSAVLFASEVNYSVENLKALSLLGAYTYGGYQETMSDTGPFRRLSLTVPVTNGTLKLGVKSNGRASSLGFSFPNLIAGNGHGWFKVDNFTLSYIGGLTDEVNSNAELLNITVEDALMLPAFSKDIFDYKVILPVGAVKVLPLVTPAVLGVGLEGVEEIILSSSFGQSVIKVTSLDGTSTKTYTLNYEVKNPVVLTGTQQEKLYTNEFPVKDVNLLDGPFKHAMDLNRETLLKYDVDRLLAPYRKEAGLSAKASSYTNWIGLDGHIGGHYLTSMAINYAATGDLEIKNRMDYMVDELEACQSAHAINHPSWGIGYAGGVPNSTNVWSTLRTGNFSTYYAAWVPWYNLHKTYAGLRDAWLYGQNEKAKTVFLKFCDWAIRITAALSDAQMETMLNIEHGGMNEVLADAYQMTSDVKYLTAAKRFSHKQLLNSMAVKSDNLDNMHANTQVPKAVGFQRIAELSNESNYLQAGEFFWSTVVGNRTLALGGNSRNEYFPAASAHKDYISSEQGPESCNTNNMLKLTEDLFRISPQAKYADYYERALYNHILSTQHPDHGGYVYFTPARPQHYRVYSAPNEAMWCCVGTGMENHGKYGEFIYTHVADSLYVNLFIASELTWENKQVKITQVTKFPDEEQTLLKISAEQPTQFALKIRSPKWVKAGDLKITINSDTLDVVSVPESYITINRTWSSNDSVKVLLPMHTYLEDLPNVPEYKAVMHGPILLSARSGIEDLEGLVADDSRMGHVASGTMLPLNQAPVIVGNPEEIRNKIQAVPGKPLHFIAPELFPDSSDSSLVLEPFYKIHDARYMMYWLTLTADQYQHVLDSLAELEQMELVLEARTIDKVAPGEQQPEADHNLLSLNSYTGNWMNEFWRDARGDNGSPGFISYNLATKGLTKLALMVRYWGNETGSRSFNIFIDDQLLVTENVVGKWNRNEFVNQEYTIPDSLIAGKAVVRVKFQAINSSNVVGGLFYVRMLTKDATGFQTLVGTLDEKRFYEDKKSIFVENIKPSSSLKIFDLSGKVLCVGNSLAGTYKSIALTSGVKIVQLTEQGKIYQGKVIVR